MVNSSHKIARDTMLLSMTPHMHLRGKAFKYVAKYPDGNSEVLLDVPNYDFNWQLSYDLGEPKLLPSGTRIVCTAVFDNSENNLSNPNPDKIVRWGNQSWEEMMIGFFDTVPARGGEPPKSDPTGRWSWDQKISLFKIKNELDLTLEGNQLKGTYQGMTKGKQPIHNGSVSGNRISLEVPVMLRGSQMTAVFDGLIDGDKIDGTVILDSGLGSSEEFPWQAELISDEKDS